MKQFIVALTLLGCCLPAPAASDGQPTFSGTWEAARSINDERLYIVLGAMGRAEIVEEYMLPGSTRPQRARSSTFGTWSRSGNDVVVSYGKVKDRLRYVPRASLAAVGLAGSAPGLKPVGKPATGSKIGSETLWRAPHDYHMKPPTKAQGLAPVPPPEGEAAQ